MPTQKHRVNLSVPAHLDRALHRLAARDEQSVSTKALDLLTLAIEIEEDEVLSTIATRRESKRAAFISHQKAWR